MWDKETIEAAVVLTFEEMAFLDVGVGRPVETIPVEEGPWLSLTYSQPRWGCFALYLPKTIKFAVAGAIYGEDVPSVTSAQFDDSLLELLNVLAGRLLTLRFGPDQTYAMGLPTVLYERPEALSGVDPKSFFFHSDANEITLLWSEVPE